MKQILAVALLILSVAVISDLVGSAEFGSNSTNISNPYLSAKMGTAQFITGYGSKSHQYEYMRIKD